jgi:hypothetical protein
VPAVRRDVLAKRADVPALRARLRGGMEEPSPIRPGNALIKRDNPQMSDELLAYGHRNMNEYASSPAPTPRPQAS